MTDRAAAGSSRLRLRRMTGADVPFAVREHRAHFSEGFFAELGQGFLTSYYRAYVLTNRSLGYIAELDGRPVGYLVGATDPYAHRRAMLRRHGCKLLFQGLGGLAFRPRLATRFLRTRARRYAMKLLGRPSGGGPGRGAGGGVGTLAHLAVTRRAQGRGVGSALVERFLRDAAASGCHQLLLVTASGPHGAGQFYLKRGWQPLDVHADIGGRLLTTFRFAVTV